MAGAGEESTTEFTYIAQRKADSTTAHRFDPALAVSSLSGQSRSENREIVTVGRRQSEGDWHGTTALRSSDLSSVGCDAASETLEIQFHEGPVYPYYRVPESVHWGLMAAPSHGKYFHRHTKDCYAYRKIR